VFFPIQIAFRRIPIKYHINLLHILNKIEKDFWNKTIRLERVGIGRQLGGENEGRKFGVRRGREQSEGFSVQGSEFGEKQLNADGSKQEKR
jgi:hypothetical protein